jgi:AAA domain
MGRRVTQGAVLFVAIERAALVKRKLAGFRLYHGIADLPLAVLSGSIDLCTGKMGTEGIIECARRLEDESELKLGLVVVDTVSRALAGGDENSAKDMGAFVAHIYKSRRPRLPMFCLPITYPMSKTECVDMVPFWPPVTPPCG